MNKKGFTLIELAIVVVVIGLLTGGILVAKSMILTAKINKLVMDIGKYEIAINNFYLNYKYFPGDDPYFTPPGNGNDILHYGPGVGICAVAPNAALSNHEGTQSWAHLSEAKMLDHNFVPYSPTGACVGGIHSSNSTSASLAGVVWPYTELESNTVFPSTKWYIIPSKSAGTNLYLVLQVNYNYVLAMESKMDGKDYNVTNLQTGLVNRFNKGNCVDINNATVSCNAEGAIYGSMRYYIPPL